jgi:hypothetical protein
MPPPFLDNQCMFGYIVIFAEVLRKTGFPIDARHQVVPSASNIVKA